MIKIDNNKKITLSGNEDERLYRLEEQLHSLKRTVRYLSIGLFLTELNLILMIF